MLEDWVVTVVTVVTAVTARTARSDNMFVVSTASVTLPRVVSAYCVVLWLIEYSLISLRDTGPESTSSELSSPRLTPALIDAGTKAGVQLTSPPSSTSRTATDVVRLLQVSGVNMK